MLGIPSSYMTFQLLHSEFPYIWGKFYFLFYQCILPSNHFLSLSYSSHPLILYPLSLLLPTLSLPSFFPPSIFSHPLTSARALIPVLSFLSPLNHPSCISSPTFFHPSIFSAPLPPSSPHSFPSSHLSTSYSTYLHLLVLPLIPHSWIFTPYPLHLSSRLTPYHLDYSSPHPLYLSFHLLPSHPTTLHPSSSLSLIPSNTLSPY